MQRYSTFPDTNVDFVTKYHLITNFLFTEATLSIIGDIPIDEIPGENKPRGPNGDLKQKLYYDSDRGTTGQRLFNGSYQLLPSKFLLIIILASTLPLIKTC